MHEIKEEKEERRKRSVEGRDMCLAVILYYPGLFEIAFQMIFLKKLIFLFF
jgi:hypothetical protein